VVPETVAVEQVVIEPIECNNLFRANDDNTECINDLATCSDIQILSSTGYCTNCDNYFRANIDKTVCINNVGSCSITQKLSADGYCVDCDQYFRANADKSDCITDICEVREFKDITGVCS
jgi:hypothetical protein